MIAKTSESIIQKEEREGLLCFTSTVKIENWYPVNGYVLQNRARIRMCSGKYSMWMRCVRSVRVPRQ